MNHPHGDEDETRRIWHDLRELVLGQDMRRAVADALGLSFNRAKALTYIDADGPMPLRALAARMFIDAPYATVIVDDLVKRGLAERTANPADRRSKLVHATAEGRRIAARAMHIQDTPPPGLAAATPEELAVLRRVADRLLKEVQGRDEGAADADGAPAHSRQPV
ncbi:hypothetical protein BIV57_09805 [Mangrovactinospora gilvigrisea]|uniref:HTH marR-type domain-containing protein n=1 Tax=Mangrovactinospora gilvigrisea TaxID=1428644 RepID=A0A1J7BG61_9ACTN|nr:MarR family transcriptional regulator [Mangrovactinospora gilvigrisea]OIV37655.1 hypothetical protein BIV57_09805 [Mangrovactinospora gilvigrisea]